MVYKRSMKKRGYKKRTFRSKTTLKSLSKAVKVLQKKTRLVTERDTYLVTEAIDVVTPYTATNLCNFSSWGKLWSSTTYALGDNRSTMYHRNFKIDNLVTLDNINNEEGTVGFTYMIISRRDTAGSATDTANSLTLTSNVDYRSVGGMTFLNLKKWKIHFIKRFTLTQMDIAGDGQSSDQAQRRFTATVKVGNRIVNPDGAWNQLQNSPDPSDTYYAVLFNDNSSADLENPRWTFNCIHQVDN